MFAQSHQGSDPEPSELIHDWSEEVALPRAVMVKDETLRDGLQSPSVREPSTEDKLRILALMEGLGLDALSTGIPASGAKQQEDAKSLCQEIATQRFRIRPSCGGRTLPQDVVPIVDIGQETGISPEALLFIGSSPVRRLAESWTMASMVENTVASIEYATREGLDVTYITEDTTRAKPDQLRELFVAAVGAGAKRVCLCDTVGCATPRGVVRLVSWVRDLLDDLSVDVEIDWHGHRDRGLALANTLAAIEAGATRVHGTALGVGERVGNAAIEEILVNLKLCGYRSFDLSTLNEYSRTVSEAIGVPIPPHTPIIGRDAFRTMAGVHASAIAKAQRQGDSWLAERVYCSVPASWLGRKPEIEIGPQSGTWNVLNYLEVRGLTANDSTVEGLLQKAKATGRVLTQDEVLDALGK